VLVVGVVGYLVFGVETTSDPAQIRAALDSMTDIQLAPGLDPLFDVIVSCLRVYNGLELRDLTASLDSYRWDISGQLDTRSDYVLDRNANGKGGEACAALDSGGTGALQSS
jgi:hypothetical protein